MQNGQDVLLIDEGQDGFITLTLNRPRRLNALNPDLLVALKSAVEQAETNPSLKGMILMGAGGNFCAGGDIFSMRKAVDAGDIHALSPFLSILEETVATFFACPIPTLCVLDGVVAGAGLGLALAADIRIATDETHCHMAFSTLGAIPDAGSSYLLPRVIGYARAMEFYISGEPLEASQGLTWGLFHEVAPREKIGECLTVWKGKISRLSPKGFRLSKELFQQSLSQSLKDQTRAEYFSQLTTMKSSHFARKVTELTTKKE